MMTGEGGVFCITSSPHHCDVVFAGFQSGAVMKWDIAAGCCSTFHAHKESVRAVAVSSNGEMLYSGGRDCTLKAWSTRSFTMLYPPQRMTDWVFAIVSDAHAVYVGVYRSAVNVLDGETGRHDASLVLPKPCAWGMAVWPSD